MEKLPGIFVADYKGTCALCWDTVNPGDELVRTMVKTMGINHHRNVHEECQRLLIECSPPDMAKDFRAEVIE